MTTIISIEAKSATGLVRLSNGRGVKARVIEDVAAAGLEIAAAKDGDPLALLRRRFVALSEEEIIEILQACEVPVARRRAPQRAAILSFPLAA